MVQVDGCIRGFYDIYATKTFAEAGVQARE